MLLVDFGMGNMLAICVVLCCCSAQFQHAREECESKRVYVF